MRRDPPRIEPSGVRVAPGLGQRQYEGVNPAQAPEAPIE